jgi:TolB-like protein
VLAGCLYKFSGGGFPPDVKTVAVLPFDNLTSEPILTSEIATAVREAVQNRLGLRQAGESQADAVVRGTVTGYNPDVPVAFNATGNQAQPVQVNNRLVQITLNIEIVDQKSGKTLWSRQGLMTQGDYDPTRESEAQARQKALDKIVTDIVDGAQSQW